MQRLSSQCSPLYGWAPKLASQSLEQRGGSEPLFSLEASFRPGPGWFQQVPVLDSSQFSGTGVEAGAAFPSSALCQGWQVKDQLLSLGPLTHLTSLTIHESQRESILILPQGIRSTSQPAFPPLSFPFGLTQSLSSPKAQQSQASTILLAERGLHKGLC